MCLNHFSTTATGVPEHKQAVLQPCLVIIMKLSELLFTFFN